MELGPPGLLLSVGFDPSGSESLGYGRDYRTVEPAREQHPVGHVAHQLPTHGFLERFAQLEYRGGIVLDGIVAGPFAFVPTDHLPLAARIVVAGQEGFVALAETLERLQFAGTIEGAVAVVSDIQRNDTYGVTGDEKLVALFVVEGKGKNAVQLLQKVDTLVAVECQYHLAVATRLKLVLTRIPLPDFAVVVNLAIDGKHLLAVGRVEGLASALGVDNREALMGQDGRASAIDAAPVGAPVTNLLGHGQGFLTPLGRLALNIEYGCYSTHDKGCFMLFYAPVSIVRR